DDTSSSLSTLTLFFFSSRRRHTRWPRDWSSDVCSSDLWVASSPPSSPPGLSRRGAALAGDPRRRGGRGARDPLAQPRAEEPGSGGFRRVRYRRRDGGWGAPGRTAAPAPAASPSPPPHAHSFDTVTGFAQGAR